MVARSGRTRRIASTAVLAMGAFAVAAADPQDNTFSIVGSSGVSGLMLFLSEPTKIVFVDKTEGNGNNLNIGGHPAWSTEYDITTNSYRPLDVVTNSFCAGGNVLGNGTWLNVGGNQPVGAGGLNANANSPPYEDGDGGRAIRIWQPCNNSQCDWLDMPGAMTTRRWYPTLETLEDGSIIIIGGCDFGGYVNDAGQNNPTFEYYPSRGAPIGLNLLTSTLPANLFPLVWLLPSGNLFINANLGNEIFDYKHNTEHYLASTPHAVRTYPGSAATALMPMTPANNWTATILMCGGTNLQPDQWVTTWNIAAYPADQTCISMTPDISTAWVDEDPLPEGRVMGNFIILPDGRLVLLNGIGSGTAGYGNTSWAIGQSFGNNPIYAPAYYDRSLPAGQRFYRDGMGNSTVPRMYHSSATLLPDGSILSAGSNPNADFIANGTKGYPFPTEYRVERFYPDYYSATRPAPTGLPTTLGYGGNYFQVQLSANDVGQISNLANTKVVVLRFGFSTHAMNMGQRYVQLNNTAVANTDGSATLYVNQMPNNVAIFPPGPAYIFVVVNGIPSTGQPIMVGSGKIGTQTVAAVQPLPPSSGYSATGAVATSSGSDSNSPSSATASSTTNSPIVAGKSTNSKSAAPRSSGAVATGGLLLIVAVSSILMTSVA